jgi:hypothetical protein
MKNVIQIINNVEDKYPGDLKHYLRVIWYSPNVNVPYHNLRHMLHVMWATYQGAQYYKDQIDPRTLRNMLIAALFHDYNHPGESGNDSKNIEIAIKGLKTFILHQDRPFLDEICGYIKATQFPHLKLDLTLPGKIIRDADVAYTLSDAWIQTVSFGLSEEIGLSTEEMLRGQEGFLKSLQFETEWAKNEYGNKSPIVLKKQKICVT